MKIAEITELESQIEANNIAAEAASDTPPAS